MLNNHVKCHACGHLVRKQDATAIHVINLDWLPEETTWYFGPSCKPEYSRVEYRRGTTEKATDWYIILERSIPVVEKP